MCSENHVRWSGRMITRSVYFLLFEVGRSFRFLSLRISSKDLKIPPTYSVGFLMQKSARWTAFFRENRLSRSCQLGQSTSLQSTFPPTSSPCSIRWGVCLTKKLREQILQLFSVEDRAPKIEMPKLQKQAYGSNNWQPMWRIFVTARLCQKGSMLIANNCVVGFSKY